MTTDYVLFDLDGTLTDSFEGITNSVIYALDKMGVPHGGNDSLRCFIGPPLFESFGKALGGDADQAARAVSIYREYFADKGILENRVYDGVKNMLASLKAMGLTLAVATSKPEVFSRRIISHFGLDRYFAFVAGATMDSSRIDKSDVIAYALKSLGADPRKTVMVGDREHDIIGAKNNGLKSIGVLYGYGDRAELTAAGADYIATTANDVTEIIINLE